MSATEMHSREISNMAKWKCKEGAESLKECVIYTRFCCWKPSLCITWYILITLKINSKSILKYKITAC